MASTGDRAILKHLGDDRDGERRRARFSVEESERRRKIGQSQRSVEEIARDAGKRFNETLKRLGE